MGITEVFGQRFINCVDNIGLCDNGMMMEATICNFLEFILKIGSFHNTVYAEKFFIDGIGSNGRLIGEESKLSVCGSHAAQGDFSGFDLSDIKSPAAFFSLAF